MERSLTPEERDFIAGFREQVSQPSSAEAMEEKEAVRDARKSKLFAALIGTLAFAPFLLSGLFLYGLGRFQTLFGQGNFSTLRETLTDEELEALGASSELESLSTVVTLYDQRGTIVAAIFTVFVLLIALALLVRIMMRSFRSTN